MRRSILPNEGIDQVHLSGFKPYPTVSAAGASVNVHLAHLGCESTERFIYSKVRSAARQKYGTGTGQVCHVEDSAEKNGAGLIAQSRAPAGRNATARKRHGTEREK
jgi:hypothetical protein